jgi:hypothetical protein
VVFSVISTLYDASNHIHYGNPRSSQYSILSAREATPLRSNKSPLPISSLSTVIDTENLARLSSLDRRTTTIMTDYISKIDYLKIDQAL